MILEKCLYMIIEHDPTFIGHVLQMGHQTDVARSRGRSSIARWLGCSFVFADVCACSWYKILAYGVDANSRLARRLAMASASSSSGYGGVLPNMLWTPGDDGLSTAPVDSVSFLVKEMEEKAGRDKSGSVIQEWLLYVQKEKDDAKFTSALCALEWWEWKENWRLACITAHNLKNKGKWLPASHSLPCPGWTLQLTKEANEPQWFGTPHSVFHEL